MASSFFGIEQEFHEKPLDNLGACLASPLADARNLVETAQVQLAFHVSAFNRLVLLFDYSVYACARDGLAHLAVLKQTRAFHLKFCLAAPVSGLFWHSSLWGDSHGVFGVVPLLGAHKYSPGSKVKKNRVNARGMTTSNQWDIWETP